MLYLGCLISVHSLAVATRPSLRLTESQSTRVAARRNSLLANTYISLLYQMREAVLRSFV